mmetsp:Transcript_22004/g.65631  ORF Transcript_22004/g.65631 Transcript_22004/m.65631 type:complete len:265 (-) Transcript_22004:246-1040(-)
MDPMVDVPNEGHRLLRIRQRLLVARRPVLRDHRRDRVPPLRLLSPDQVPPALVALHVGEPLGRARVRYLRPVVVAHPAMRVVHLRGDDGDRLVQHRVGGVRLRHVDPMGQIRAELDLRENFRVSLEEGQGRPRRVQEPLAVGLVAHHVPVLLLPLQRVPEKRRRHLEGEVVLQTVGDHLAEQVPEGFVSRLHLLLEHGCVSPHDLLSQGGVVRAVQLPRQTFCHLFSARRARKARVGAAPQNALPGDNHVVGEHHDRQPHVMRL